MYTYTGCGKSHLTYLNFNFTKYIYVYIRASGELQMKETNILYYICNTDMVYNNLQQYHNLKEIKMTKFVKKQPTIIVETCFRHHGSLLPVQRNFMKTVNEHHESIPTLLAMTSRFRVHQNFVFDRRSFGQSKNYFAKLNGEYHSVWLKEMWN